MVVGSEEDSSIKTMGILRGFNRHNLQVRDQSNKDGSGKNVKGSAGAFWSASRCAIDTVDQVYVGIDNAVYHVAGADEVIRNTGQGESFVLGKDDVVLPVESPRPLELVPLQAFAHRFEVQSVTLWDSSGRDSQSQFVASVDSTGSLCVCEYRSGVGADKSNVCPERSYQALPASCSAMEVGWSGVALGQHQPTLAVVARHFRKDLNVFDGDMLVRSISTLQNPTAIRMMEENVYLVGEGNKLGVYDLRVSEKQGCVQCNVLNDVVTSLATQQHSFMRVASGVGRSAILWDIRKWNILQRFSGMRQEVCGLEFLKDSGRRGPPLLCVATINGEVNVIGMHTQKRQKGTKDKQKLKSLSSLRGDSRWIGLGLAQPQYSAKEGGEGIGGDGGGGEEDSQLMNKCIGFGISGGLYSFALS